MTQDEFSIAMFFSVVGPRTLWVSKTLICEFILFHNRFKTLFAYFTFISHECTVEFLHDLILQ